MADYQPLDLSTLCNAGLEVLGANVDAPLGKQAFRGLPFLVNADGSKCFIALNDASGKRDYSCQTSPCAVLLSHIDCWNLT